jgi:hypothetical protein
LLFGGAVYLDAVANASVVSDWALGSAAAAWQELAPVTRCGIFLAAAVGLGVFGSEATRNALAARLTSKGGSGAVTAPPPPPPPNISNLIKPRPLSPVPASPIPKK